MTDKSDDQQKSKITFAGDVNSASMHLLIDTRAMLQVIFNMNVEIISSLKSSPSEKVRKDYAEHHRECFGIELAEMIKLYGDANAHQPHHT